MRENKDQLAWIALAFGSLGLIGFLAWREFNKKEKQEIKIFDCPQCGLPCEIGMILVHSYSEIYVLFCVGQHSPTAVTSEWLKDQLPQ